MCNRSLAAAAVLSILFMAAVSPALAGLMTRQVWEAGEDQAGGSFGEFAAGAGDVNGDGYADVLVSAPYYDNGETDEGVVYLFLGSATGPLEAPVWTAESNQQNVLFGYPVGSAGDLNNDGYADIFIGAPYYDFGGNADAGGAFIWFGGPSSPANPSGLGPNGTPDNADWKAFGTQADEVFGVSVAPAGDVNMDGRMDIIIGAKRYESSVSQLNEGRAYVYYGTPAGPSPTPGWTAEGNQYLANLGASVASAGDVNKDGASDVIIGANAYNPGGNGTNTGAAFLYLGSASGLGPNGTPFNADWRADATQEEAYMGSSVGAGDFNGDGYSDIMVGAPYFNNDQVDEGRAYVWYGGASTTGTPSGLGANGSPANADWLAESDQLGGFLGYPLSVGDFNGDGYDDLLTAASYTDVGSLFDAGQGLVWFGSSSGLGPLGHPSNADWRIDGDAANGYFGYGASSVGDVNGDGLDDVIIGQPGYVEESATDAGKAYVFLVTCGSTDADGDGVAPVGAAGCGPGGFTDCNDSNAAVWGTPGEARELLVAPDRRTLSWEAPLAGGTPAGMVYDALRSPDPANFTTAALCLESNDGPNTTAVDTAVPPAGSALFFLVRAENSCTAGAGSLGRTSSGAERTGRGCP